MNSNNIYTETSANLGAKKDPAKSGFQSASYAKIAKNVIIGTIISLFSSVILLIVFAFIVNAAFRDPDKAIDIFTAIGASAGALIGGFQASKRNGSNGLISGLFTGLTTSLVIFAVMIFGGKPDGGDNNAANIATANAASITLKIALVVCHIIFASIGGVFAVNSHNANRSRSYSPGSKSKKK